MKIRDKIKRHFFSKSDVPTVIGVAHTTGYNGEKKGDFDYLTEFLDGMLQGGDKVMLEIPEDWEERFPSELGTTKFYERLSSYLEQKGCHSLFAEDKDRWGKDSSYHDGHVRDELFIEKLSKHKPKVFCVGNSHLRHLKNGLPGYNFINLNRTP